MSRPHRMSTNRRVPGGRAPALASIGLDLIGRAIEQVDAGNLLEALKFWERARAFFVESHAELAHLYRADCELAIERLRARIGGDESVDLTPALKPDMGKSAEARRRAVERKEVVSEADALAKIAAENLRKCSSELAELDRLIPQLRSGSFAYSWALRLKNDLVTGAKRGVPEEEWRTLMRAAKFQGVR